MRKLNVKFLFSLVVAVVALAGTLALVHSLQAGNIASALLWQANQAEQEGRLKQSSRFLARYLEFAPDDLETRARLGKLLCHQKLAVSHKARERARFVIDQVLIKEPGNTELRKCLVRLALDENNLDVAHEQLKILEQQAPQDGEVSVLSAQYEEHRGYKGHALLYLKQAVKKSPEFIDGYVRLIRLMREFDKYAAEASQYAAEALRRAPNDVAVLIAASELAQDRALTEYGRERLSGILTGMVCRVTQEHCWDTAAAYLDRALKLQSREGRVHQALAQLEVRRGQRDRAIAALRAGLKVVPQQDRFELTWTLTNLLLDGGDIDEAVRLIPQTRVAGVPAASHDFLKARVLMAQGRWYDASTQFVRVRDGLKGAPGLVAQVDLFLASCYERLKEPAQQLAACQRVLYFDKTSVAGRRSAAAALMAMGRTDLAIEEYRKLAELGQQTQQVNSGQLDLARALLTRNLGAAKADWTAVEQALAAAEQEQPGAVDVVLLRAEMLLARKQPDQVRALLEAALQKQPRSVALWNGLAVLEERQGRAAEARRVLDRAEAQLGDCVAVRLARARLVAAVDKGDAARAALAKLEAGWQQLPAEERPALLSGLAEAYLRTDQLRDATRLWRLVAEQPRFAKDVRVRLVLFDLGLRLGDDEQMRQALAEVKTLEEGESPFYLYGEAARRIYLARQGQTGLLKEARRLLDRVVQLRPAWPAVLLARAEVEEMQGNTEQAIANYRRALEQGERGPRVLRQLVQLLTKQQRYDEADQVMRQLQQQAQLSPDDQKLFIDVSLRNDDFRAAEDILSKSTPADSKDYHDQLWIGKVLSANGRPSAEAEKAFRRAIALADAVPETWVALIQYLVRINQAPLAQGTGAGEGQAAGAARGAGAGPVL